MPGQPRAARILLCEAGGFVLLISLAWLNELCHLPALVFGGPSTGNWREAAMETTVILGVWLMVHSMTRRILGRLYYLEDFLQLCAWCRRVKTADTWVPVEEFLKQDLDIGTSHGICPDCMKKVIAEAGLTMPDPSKSLTVDHKLRA